MKKICIFGSGGFAKEVFWLAKQCDKEIDAFIDIDAGGVYCDTKIVGEDYFDPNDHVAVVAVGDPSLRQKIVNKIITQHGDNVFDTLVSPFANIMSKSTINVGYGTIICSNCVLTCDIKLGNWSQLNLSTTIGHDTKTGDFFTTAPGVHISGKVNAAEKVYLGTNASVIENINICSDVIIGAAACVAKNIIESGTYIGIPAKKLEKKK